MDTPHLRKQGTATQLIVDGKPFLMIGGELHNSSSSSLEYMKPIWQRMVAMHFNTLLVPVSWELIEPEEGQFEFGLVDGLIQEARQFGLKLVFLWFGSWKNGVSSYVPAWVKRDGKRFARMRVGAKGTVEVLATVEANCQADSEAFAALMRHIREVDGDEHTVVMVQVENEVGVLGDSRDRSDLANAAFARPVPAELVEYLKTRKDELVAELGIRWEQNGFKTEGSWEEIFGAGVETDELFMAWHYARYIDCVAAAGKAEYDIPMYVNAWLNSPQQKPGDYPSGGPLPHVMDMWLAGAPHIDVLAPDIYATEFADWCQRYTQRGNPLLIPETRNGEDGARNIFYAIGQHDAMCVSPFAVDSIANLGESALAKSYAVLRQLEGVILESQGKEQMVGVVLDKEHPTVCRNLRGYELEISLDAIFGYKAELGYGVIIATGEDEFVAAGYGLGIRFRPNTGEGSATAKVGIVGVEEGTYRDGQWVSGRRLNGDETDGGQKWRFPIQGIGIQQCKVYKYE